MTHSVFSTTKRNPHNYNLPLHVYNLCRCIISDTHSANRESPDIGICSAWMASDDTTVWYIFKISRWKFSMTGTKMCLYYPSPHWANPNNSNDNNVQTVGTCQIPRDILAGGYTRIRLLTRHLNIPTTWIRLIEPISNNSSNWIHERFSG